MTATAASAIDATGAAIAADDTTAATAIPIHDLPALVAGDLVFAVAPPAEPKRPSRSSSSVTPRWF